MTMALLSGTTVRAGAVAALVAVAGLASGPAGQAHAAGRFPATFIGVATTAPAARLAVFSAADGHRLRYLTTPQPGGGVFAPALSASGRTVAFERALGTCAGAIHTVPAAGGKERVLVPLTSPGGHDTLPFSPVYSSDGRYLLYSTTRCFPPFHRRIHLRTLATGHELTRPGVVPSGAVFVSRDQRVVHVGTGGMLAVRPVPAFTTQPHAAPRGCRYQAVAGTETRLVAVLQCGARHRLSLVAISLRTFTIIRTLNRLGSCLGSTDLSLATGDPSAMLVETYNACQPPDSRQVRILEIRGHTIRLVRSGRIDKMPREVLW